MNFKNFVLDDFQSSVVGVDIFTNKKYEDSFPSSHNVPVPFVTKKE